MLVICTSYYNPLWQPGGSAHPVTAEQEGTEPYSRLKQETTAVHRLKVSNPSYKLKSILF